MATASKYGYDCDQSPILEDLEAYEVLEFLKNEAEKIAKEQLKEIQS